MFSKYIMNSKSLLPKVIFVLGPPGAGKGTQCQRIVKRFKFVHLSAGDLLRQERENPNSEYGSMITDCIENGKIVPVAVTCKLIENAMEAQKPSNHFLIDGFPRNEDNLLGWESTMADKVQLLCVLYFECPEETCIKRCLNRGLCGSGRIDDNALSLKKRFQTFLNDSLPIIQCLKESSLVETIDASRPPEEVFERVEQILIGSYIKDEPELVNNT